MKLFTPFQLGCTVLQNRVVMSPMTRNRAIGNLANPLMAAYYGQRALAGLIITEGTSPSPNGLGNLGLAYLHLVDHSSMGAPKPLESSVSLICANFRASGGGGVIQLQLLHV